MLSIVQMHSHDYGGGAEAVARLNHAALSGLGHQSQLIVARKKGEDSGTDQMPYRRGIPGSRRLAKNIESLTGLQYVYSPSFRHVSDQFRVMPDVVHLHALHGAGGWADLVGVAQLAKKYPVVFSLHDLWWLTGHCAYGMECERWKTGCGNCPDLSRYPAVPKDATRWNWKRKRRLFARKQFDCIAPSEWVRKQASESPILHQSRIHVVPNPIDTKVFKMGNRKESRLRLQIPENRPTILVAANHLDSQFKGADDAIEVLNGLGDTNAFAILVGRNSLEMAKQISLPSKAIGYVDSAEKMADCYRAADVFLIPSRVETFGLVSAEAVACGTTVVSYQAGGLEEVTKTGHGIVVQDRNVKELLEATRHLLNSENERKERIALGHAKVTIMYSAEAHATGCINIYREAIKEFDVNQLTHE